MKVQFRLNAILLEVKVAVSPQLQAVRMLIAPEVELLVELPEIEGRLDLFDAGLFSRSPLNTPHSAADFKAIAVTLECVRDLDFRLVISVRARFFLLNQLVDLTPLGSRPHPEAECVSMLPLRCVGRAKSPMESETVFTLQTYHAGLVSYQGR